VGSILGSCSVGQLTDRGILMHQTLGMNLHTKYVTLFNLFTDPEMCANPAEYLYVRSTNIQRTIQSAESNMFTFKRNCTINSLVDLWIPQAVDEFQPTSLEFICPAIKKYDFFSSPEAQMIYTQYSQLVTQAEQIFQITNLSPVDLLVLYDPLIVRYCHNITHPLPPNIPNSFMIELDTFFNRIVELSYTWNSSLVASPMMNIMLNDWMNYIANPSVNPLGPKYSLFSAHDSTVGYALAFLGVLTTLNLGDPPYASHIEFELWQQGSNYWILISLNGEYLSLPNCGGILCDFNKWYKSLPLYTPQQWQVECYS